MTSQRARLGLHQYKTYYSRPSRQFHVGVRRNRSTGIAIGARTGFPGFVSPPPTRGTKPPPRKITAQNRSKKFTEAPSRCAAKPPNRQPTPPRAKRLPRRNPARLPQPVATPAATAEPDSHKYPTWKITRSDASQPLHHASEVRC